MYLEYNEYTSRGGALESAAFADCEKKAERLIKSQAGGLTGERLDSLSELPEAVRDCVFDLIGFIASGSLNEGRITSESQSQGDISASRSYSVRTDEEIRALCEDIIYNSFFGGGIGELLYRGAGYGD